MNISREKLSDILRKVYPFHQLDGTLFKMLLENAELVYFPDEKMIFKEGAIAEAFYIVLEGEVDILKEVRRSLVYKNVIKPFFCFGEDLFSDNARRQTSARALGEVVLLKINMSVMRTLRAEDAFFSSGIANLYTSYAHLLSKPIEKIPSETIAYISQPHPFPLVVKMLAILVVVLGVGIASISLYNNGIVSGAIFQWLAGLLTAACLGYVAWMYYEWSNDYLFLTDKRVHNTKRTTLIFEEKQDTPLSAIESIQVRKHLIGRALNYGDIDIKTFTGAVRIPAVPNVAAVQQFLQFLTARRVAIVDREEISAFQDEVRERINGGTGKSISQSETRFDQIGQGVKRESAKPAQQSDHEAEDLIIRKHWTILFSKIFIPAFLLMSFIFLYFFLLFNNFEIINNVFFGWTAAVVCFLAAAWSGYQFLDWRNDMFIITDDMLIDVDKRPFGMEEKRTAPINRIQSIRFKKKGVFGLLLNFGTVFIRIGDEEFTFDNVYHPAEIQDILFNAKESVQKREDNEQRDQERKRAVGWMDAYHQLMQEEKKDSADDK